MSILSAQTDPGNRGYIEAAAIRMRQTETISRELEGAAAVIDDADALAVADLIRESARPDNFYAAENMSSSSGELFDGYGSLTSASTRLDPNYMVRASRRAQKRAVEYMDRCKPQAGERLQLVTLTMPKTDAAFALTMTLLHEALVLLKKRKWFKETVRGAVIGKEFTMGEAGEHWHAHAHILCWAKRISWQQLGEQWTDCLESAARRLGVSAIFAPTTVHGRAIVDVEPVTYGGRVTGAVAQREAVRRVCGYILKGPDFSTVPQAQKCAVMRVLDGKRLFETFGECNFRKGQRATSAASNLVNQNTVDGDTGKPARPGEDAASTTHRSKSARSAALKTVGAEMIRQGNRDEWLQLLSTKFKKRRAWRMTQLAKIHPQATFTTLDGRVWQGEAYW